MSKQKNGGQKKGKGKTAKHSPSDAMQKARTAANKQRRISNNEIDKHKEQTKKVRTAEQYRVAYYNKQREKLAVRNPEILYPNGNPQIARLIATWKAHRSMKGKG